MTGTQASLRQSLWWHFSDQNQFKVDDGHPQSKLSVATKGASLGVPARTTECLFCVEPSSAPSPWSSPWRCASGTPWRPLAWCVLDFGVEFNIENDIRSFDFKWTHVVEPMPQISHGFAFNTKIILLLTPSHFRLPFLCRVSCLDANCEAGQKTDLYAADLLPWFLGRVSRTFECTLD